MDDKYLHIITLNPKTTIRWYTLQKNSIPLALETNMSKTSRNMLKNEHNH